MIGFKVLLPIAILSVFGYALQCNLDGYRKYLKIYPFKYGDSYDAYVKWALGFRGHL